MREDGGVLGLGSRSLLPGELAAAAAADGRVRRTFRDGAVDALLFLGAGLVGLVVLGLAESGDERPGWLMDLDPLLGLLVCLSLWWRRRFPLAVALLATPAVGFANSAFGAGFIVIGNLALRLPWQRAVPVLALYAAAEVPYALLVPAPNGEMVGQAAFTASYVLGAFACGSALRARRALVLKLREDADRERADHARRLAHARRAEREAIAREMHDVLAHRISLLSVHAGALAYRTKQSDTGSAPALSDAEISDSAQVIRGNAHQALEELREVLHMLRDDDPESAGREEKGRTAPQPRIGDIRELVEEARAAGQQVGLHGLPGAEELSRDGAAPLRPQQQRTAYRVVQEGLTNARKHAPGAPVTVRLNGGPGAELTVEVSNPEPTGGRDGPEIPGAGAGLTGLHERVELEGGTLEYAGRDGVFVLRARIPLPAR
ncbi:sensor histidine kinase [Streptomyces boncukensis]|uniref:histidine kinase n=1 Tax=Streptomyces boncukensis TaxID=2711219 RepID=A0A6G4X1U4_9ACTN|nr:histidine kinase [Streptomyces boncukensis]NGO70827.1 histidine kinase [Streptomyces boncukensis]